MIVTKHLTKRVFHVSKKEYRSRKLATPKYDNTSFTKILYYGNINFLVRVGFCEGIYYFGLEFNYIIN